MKNRAYLAVLILCMTLLGSACGPESPTSGTSSGGDTKTEGTTESQGSEIRLVSVKNVDKYIRIADYKGLVLDRNVYEVTDEQVEEQIRYELQSEKKEVTDENAEVQTGDLVTINYIGTVGGKVLEKEDFFDLTVGEGGMTAGFEDGLIGMKKGETRTLQLVFPEDFYAEELAGAIVTYRVTLQSIQRTPEINNKLVKSKTDAKSLKEYRKMVRADMEENAENALQDALRSIAWDTVLLNSEVKDYPKADIETAMDEFKKQVMVYNNGSDMDLEAFVKSQGMTMEAFEDQCQQYAQSKVKQNLIIQGIMDAEGITLGDAECLAIQDQLIVDFGAASLAELLDTYGQTMIDEAIGLIRIENFIVENAVFEEETATEDETAEIIFDENTAENEDHAEEETAADAEEPKA